MISVKQEMNGRIRFRLFERRDGFVAIRKQKKRWGLSSGRAFKQVHLGKYSVAIECRDGSTWNFSG